MMRLRLRSLQIELLFVVAVEGPMIVGVGVSGRVLVVKF
jgi:hypothetical protein